MKAEELRVGNWIQDLECEPYHFQLEELRKYVGYEIWAYYRNGSIKTKEIEGIPLTEELLIKLGFQEGNRGYYLKRNVVISVEGEVYFGDSDTWIASIYYVHHLQNLYFALEGEELTFN